MLVQSPTAMTRVPPGTPIAPCSQCGGRRRITGFLPDIECAECRIGLYRCESCGERSEVAVCSIFVEPPLLAAPAGNRGAPAGHLGSSNRVTK